ATREAGSIAVGPLGAYDGGTPLPSGARPDRAPSDDAPRDEAPPDVGPPDGVLPPKPLLGGLGASMAALLPELGTTSPLSWGKFVASSRLAGSIDRFSRSVSPVSGLSNTDFSVSIPRSWGRPNTEVRPPSSSPSSEEEEEEEEAKDSGAGAASTA